VNPQDRSRDGAPARRAWYADGLHFACQPDCGKCCTRHGDYDYVYLEREDVARLASHFGMPIREFRSRWTKRDDGHTILKMDGPACPFLDGSRCTVYPARPRQCDSFPFWPENLKSRERWDELGTFCPGVGKGDFIPLHVIRQNLRGRTSS
jgi:Fe-S-cluster containining protein